jgi:hypothetical protein
MLWLLRARSTMCWLRWLRAQQRARVRYHSNAAVDPHRRVDESFGRPGRGGFVIAGRRVASADWTGVEEGTVRRRVVNDPSRAVATRTRTGPRPTIALSSAEGRVSDELDELVSSHYGWSGLMRPSSRRCAQRHRSELVTVGELAPVDNYHWHDSPEPGARTGGGDHGR